MPSKHRIHRQFTIVCHNEDIPESQITEGDATLFLSWLLYIVQGTLVGDLILTGLG